MRQQTFTNVHLGDDPERGGKFFVFSAKAPLLKALTLGAKIAVQFVAERDQLIAKEAKEAGAYRKIPSLTLPIFPKDKAALQAFFRAHNRPERSGQALVGVAGIEPA